jgi:hypothetical protein
MKIIALLISALSLSSLYAQITVSSADFADADDTVRMSLATDGSIDIITTGADQNWDYSYLVADDQKLVNYLNLDNVPMLVNLAYGTFAAAKYKATHHLPAVDLPLDQVSNFLPISISDPFTYSKLNADSLATVGYSLNIEGNVLPFKSDTIEARYKFPLEFGSSYTGRGYTNVNLDPFYQGAWIQKRQRSSVVDGWGNCKTPYGNFHSIRIKHTIDEQDSLMVDFFGTSTWIELPIPQNFIYEWWTNGEKDAILRINTRMIGGDEVVTGIEYRDIYLGLDAGLTDELKNAISIFPVPAENVISIKGIAFGTTYAIVDSEGSVVMNGTLMNDQIELKQLRGGSYQIIFVTDNGPVAKSFIKL